MKFDYNIKVTDNTPQLLEALEAWVERVLTIWGMKVQDYAQLLVPTGTEDSTGIEGYVGGALKASLTYVVSAAQKTVTIGSNLFYSVYVELGTGIFAEKIISRNCKRLQSKKHRTVKTQYPAVGAQRQPLFYAVFAQLAVLPAHNRVVAGSIPASGTTPAARPAKQPDCQAWQPEQGQKG